MSTQTIPTTETLPAAVTDPGWTGNPMVFGLAGFAAGSLALALQLTGYVSTAAAGAALPVIFGSSAVATLVSTIWAGRIGQNAVAGVFGVFAGFWLSYGLLVMGLVHNWLALPPTDIVHTQGLFLITWLIVIGSLTLGTLRVSAALTLALVLVDLALLFDLIGTINASNSMVKTAGYCAFGFGGIGAYLLIGALNEACGGRNLPTGPALLRG